MRAKLTWTNCKRKLSALKEWEHNPATIGKTEAKRLLQSLEEFDQVQAIAIDAENIIVDGHQRKAVWAAAEKYGPDYEVDCRQASRKLTEKERQKLSIFLRSGTVGHYDWDMLSGWDTADLQAWGFDGQTLRDWQSDAGALKAFIEANETDVLGEGNLPEPGSGGEKENQTTCPKCGFTYAI